MNNTTTDGLKEQLAAIEHDRWADWQKYMHSKMYQETDNKGEAVMLLLQTQFNHWERQIATPYAELSEAEKNSDREQVDRYWPLIEKQIRLAELRARIDELDKWMVTMNADRSMYPIFKIMMDTRMELQQELEKDQH